MNVLKVNKSIYKKCPRRAFEAWLWEKIELDENLFYRWEKNIKSSEKVSNVIVCTDAFSLVYYMRMGNIV